MNKLIFIILTVFSLPAFALKPVAVLPDDRMLTVGQEVLIDGSSSFDENQLTLSYRWSLDISPPGFNSQIDNPSGSSIRLTPNVTGFYLIRLIVNNGTENSYPSYMVIRVIQGSEEMSLD